MRIKRRDCAVCTASSFSFRAYSLLCRPKTAEQIPERGGRVNPGLLKLESPSHPDAVEHQRQHQFRAGYRNAHIPVDLLLPKLTVLKLLLTGAVGILAGKLLPALLLSKIRIGSIIADVIRAYPAFDVSCGRRAVVLYS